MDGMKDPFTRKLTNPFIHMFIVIQLKTFSFILWKSVRIHTVITFPFKAGVQVIATAENGLQLY